ncbi:hypothetical protein A3D03_01240 [Candidatus Gottesmanbacteria bacterium RIFCSPHIGHO2_02_FULL_40_13]|uniref:Preprotein translocase subunit SecE n=1 Tax=Candidatus Gottesmanbacteria bacterium RIFCSPHIGHO2_02_FULL_40_13 TaxID=1798384 RepID=A0A1F6A611_9BACT|nr:MAG: hypothetical protein A3D03_01240 [Candidatus Gottesmanbacteria bacterium RIFCSPHIGHO2_02_FULL_40_13]
MNNKKTYQLLVDKMREVAVIPTQEMGFLTPYYKKIVPRFKHSPWKSAIILSSFFAFLLYFLLGTTLIKLVSLLQFGF